MEEKIHRWKSKDIVAQYLETIRLDLSENNEQSSIAFNIELDRNYGFIVKTAGTLSDVDKVMFHEYIIQQLKEYGYTVNRKLEEETLLQASVRARVHGKQLFGTIKLVNKPFEVRVLVTPYIDSSYDEALKRRELLDVLFS